MNRVGAPEGRAIRLRMALVACLLCAVCGVVVSAAYQVMVRDGEAWSAVAQRQRRRRLRLESTRGGLYDRRGQALALSVQVPSVSLDAVELLGDTPPSRVAEVARHSADRIAEALGLDAARVERKILRRRRFAWLKHRISADEADAVRRLALVDGLLPRVAGLRVEPEAHRYYPSRRLAAPLLGFVSPDGEGRAGIELGLQPLLAGKKEYLSGLRDRTGRLVFLDGIEDEQALAGHDIELTIDQSLQYSVEQELERARRTFEAASASAVVLEPHTGEVLAIASSPSYNPNDYRFSQARRRRLRPVVDQFEPGSTLKVFTFAAALDSGVLGWEESLHCRNGRLRIGGKSIHDTHPAGELSLEQVMAYSSNICTAEVGGRLGAERLHAYLQRFGFGQAPELPLPGAASGVLLPRGRAWLPLELATAAFGQGVAVSALQLALATSAIANGGNLMQPKLVRAVRTATGRPLRELEPEVLRRVVSEPVAKRVTELMIAVTQEGGTGRRAAISGFPVAGKTGTGQKASPAGGGYEPGRYVASFVGFVPADAPAAAIVVVVDEPGLEHGGGTVAAPVFRRIARAALERLQVMPAQEEAALQLSPAAPADRAASTLRAWRESRRAAPADIQISRASGQDSPVQLPDFTGLSVREAVRRALDLGLSPEIRGTGQLARQSPAAGSQVFAGQVLLFEFEPAT